MDSQTYWLVLYDVPMATWLHPTEIIQAVIPGLKLINLVFWSLILVWAQPAYARALFGKAEQHDWPHLAVGAAGFALIGYQLRQIVKIGEDHADYWQGVLLIVSILAAMLAVIFLHYRKTPDAHKRAILRAHGLIIILCFAGGFL